LFSDVPVRLTLPDTPMGAYALPRLLTSGIVKIPGGGL
jgi:hypothetical protein